MAMVLPRRVTLALLLLLCSEGTSAARGARDAWIDAFTGWASPHRGALYARVHRGLPEPKPVPNQSSYRRLRQTMEALEVEALAGATVSISGVPGLRSGRADRNGFLKMPLPAGLPPGPLEITLQVISPGWRSAPATLRMQVYDDQPGLGVISDIDDTLSDTGVTHKLRMLKNTLFRSTWEVVTFPGAAQAVAALGGRDGDGTPRLPLFFVSGSPWALRERLAGVFERAGFPRGSMILRRYSQEPLDGYAFKLPHLRELFAAFPHKRWVLLGDSGEKDPEVYATLRRESPERIAAVYIHLVTKEAETSARFSGARVFRDWKDVASDAATRGLLAPPTAPIAPR